MQETTENNQSEISLADVGEQLRILRNSQGLTQENIANTLNLSTTAYARIERGETDIKFSVLLKLSKVYGLTPAQLLSMKEQKVVIMNSDYSNCSSQNNNHNSFQVPTETISLLQQSLSTIQMMLQDALKRIEKLENK